MISGFAVWILLRSAVALLILVLSGRALWCRGRGWKGLLALATYCAVGILVTAPGAIVQSWSWEILNGSAVSLFGWSASPRLVLSPLVDMFTAGLLPGVVTGAVSALIRTPTSRVLGAAAAAITLLTVDDIALFVMDASPLVRGLSQPPRVEWILFSLLSDLVGGAIVGLVVPTVGRALNTFTRIERRQASAAINGPAVRRHDIALAALATPICLITAFFVFAYHLPAQIVLRLDNWTTLQFRYRSPMAAISPGLNYLPLVANITRIGPLRMDAQLHLSWGDEPRKIEVTLIAVRAFEFSAMTTDILEGRLKEAGRRGKVLFKGDVAAGRIGLRAAVPLTLYLGSDARPSRRPDGGFAILPLDRPTLLSRNYTDTSDVLLPRRDPGRGAHMLAIKGLSGKMFSTSALGRMALLARLEKGVFDVGADVSDLAISLPDGHETVVGLDTRVTALIDVGRDGAYVAAVLLLGPTPAMKHVEIASAEGAIVCNCVPEWKGSFFGALRPVVSDIHVEDASGRLNMGAKSYPLTKSATLLVGGGGLMATDEDSDGVTLKGTAHPIAINGEAVTETLWGKMPNEFRTVLVAGLLGIAGWLARTLRRNLVILRASRPTQDWPA